MPRQVDRAVLNPFADIHDFASLLRFLAVVQGLPCNSQDLPKSYQSQRECPLPKIPQIPTTSRIPKIPLIPINSATVSQK